MKNKTVKKELQCRLNALYTERDRLKYVYKNSTSIKLTIDLIEKEIVEVQRKLDNSY